MLGPSGSGKSTVLRLIAGLETPDHGEIWLDAARVDGLHPRDRNVGFVFQHYALFRHMRVWENVSFGLTVRGRPEAERRARAREMLTLMGLDGLDERFPEQLSGGQRQRVALARALAPKPPLLLLDEPFGAVDARVREELRSWLRRLHDEVHTTSIFVTHDQEEAFSVADRVVVFHEGRVEQVGTPAEILDAPATGFVASFVGEVNVLEGRVTGAGVGEAAGLRLPLVGPHPEVGARARMVVRAWDFKLWAQPDGLARARRVVPLGDRVLVDAVLPDGSPIKARFPRRSSLLQGVEGGAALAVEVTQARAYPA
jgi:sulfate transport system ATP-binding protein